MLWAALSGAVSLAHAADFDANGFSLGAGLFVPYVTGTVRVREHDSRGDSIHLGSELGVDHAEAPGLSLSYRFHDANRLFLDVDYWWELAAIAITTYLGARIAAHPRPVAAAERRVAWAGRPISIVERRVVTSLALVLVIERLWSYGYVSVHLALEPVTVVGVVVPLAILGSGIGFALSGP